MCLELSSLFSKIKFSEFAYAREATEPTSSRLSKGAERHLSTTKNVVLKTGLGAE